MIGRLTGVLIDKHPPQIMVDVHGVGYEIEVPMSTYYNLPGAGESLCLFTHLLGREDGQSLYGFATEAERAVFRQLLKVSGIGARIALALLSGMSVAEIAQAVSAQETGRLTRVPGIGKKTAERLLLELRDKLPPIATPARPPPRAGGGDILDALLALGYSEREASATLGQLPENVAVADGIRQALKLLSKA